MKRIATLLCVLMLMLASFTAVMEYPRGDVDQDGTVTVADVTCLIDYLLTGSWGEELVTPPDNQHLHGDVDHDGTVIIADVTCLIDYLLTGTWDEEPVSPPDNHEWVDLGLPSGTLWATMNVGASCSEDDGDYFAWGETEPKDVYDWSTYKWCNGSEYTQTKYCSNSDYGTVDYKTELDPEDDAAYVNWGSSWRMPTEQQLKELIYVCTWTSTIQDGAYGYKFTGLNGNTLFLPASGYCSGSEFDYAGGVYWMQSSYGNTMGHILYFNDNNAPRSTISSRYKGMSVRAVRVPHLLIEQQNFDLGEVSIGQSRTGELTIVNNTAKTQTVTVTADKPFLLEQEDSSASSINVSVPGNSRCSVKVLFTATEAGEFNGNVTFQCPAFDGGQKVIPIQAFAYSSDNPEHRYVDLGLPSGTLWATCNVGASRPEESGDYFAWGETEPKDVYDWSTYKWCNGSYNTLTKYCNGNNSGTVDNLTELYPEDDAAYVNWGSSWRMPTDDQLMELSTNCSTIWTTRNGVNGYLFIGLNGKTMFLPAAGYRYVWSGAISDDDGHYWSRTLDWVYPRIALNIDFNSKNIWHSSNDRCYGSAVRAVRVSPDETVNRLYVLQQNYDFGDVPIGETRRCELTIINYLTEDQNVVVTADEPFLLEQENNNVSSITISVPGNSRNSVTVMFTATTPGEFNGNVTFQNPAMDGGQMAIPVQAVTYTYDFPQYVDLGLPSGTLWATMNVGASRPEDYGDYFAWGETEPKDYYDWSTYKWCNGSEYTLTKYCTDSRYGTVDGKTELDPEDDAAYLNWGDNWRIPTHDQVSELYMKCTWTWTTRNGVNGYSVTGPNGASLFLPAAGYCWLSRLESIGFESGYWSRTLDFRNPDEAYNMFFDLEYQYWGGNYRYKGFPVRAVLVSPK